MIFWIVLSVFLFLRFSFTCEVRSSDGVEEKKYIEGKLRQTSQLVRTPNVDQELEKNGISCLLLDESRKRVGRGLYLITPNGTNHNY